MKKYKKMQLGGGFLPPISINDMMDFMSNLSVPQKLATQAVTGKYQTPSEAMGIKNKAGAFATDMILDPVNLLGAGLMKGVVTKGAALSKSQKMVPKHTEEIVRGPINWWDEPTFKKNNPNITGEQYINNTGKFGNHTVGPVDGLTPFDMKTLTKEQYKNFMSNERLTKRTYNNPLENLPKKKKDGGATDPTDGGQNVTRSSTPKERESWNKFFKYMYDNKISGSKDLDLRDKSLGMSYMQKFNELNPDYKVSPEFIKIAQQEAALLKQGMFPEVNSTLDFPLNQYKNKQLSPVDGWLGSITSSQISYPTIQKSMGDGTKRDFGYDYAAYKAFLESEPRATAKLRKGGPIVDPMGQWSHPGKRTIVPTKDGKITMKGVNYPVLGKDETGYSQMMFPGAEYTFPGQMVDEVPMMQQGGGTLPEVVVFGHKDKGTKAYFDKLRGNAEEYRDWGNDAFMAEYRAKELLHSKYGSPKINMIGNSDRAYYNFITDTLNIGKPKLEEGPEDVFLEELSHKVQSNKKGKVGFAKQFLGNDLLNTIKNVDVKNFFNKSSWKDSYRSNYNNKGTLEEEAHNQIYPKLKEEFINLAVKEWEKFGSDKEQMQQGGQMYRNIMLDEYQAGNQVNLFGAPNSFAWNPLGDQTPPLPVPTGQPMYRVDQTQGTPVAQQPIVPIQQGKQPGQWVPKTNTTWEPNVEAATMGIGAMSMIADQLNKVPDSRIYNNQINRATSDASYQTYNPTLKRGYIDQNSGRMAPTNQTLTQFGNAPAPSYYGNLPIAQMGGLPDMGIPDDPTFSIDALVDAGLPSLPSSYMPTGAPSSIPSLAPSKVSVDDTEFLTYMAHQQGEAGIKALTKSARSGQDWREFYKGKENLDTNMRSNINPQEFFKKYDALNAGTFLDYWKGKFNKQSSKWGKKSTQFDELINEVAPQFGFSPNFVKTVVGMESSFDPNASAGSHKGLLQLNEKEARRKGVKDVYNPVENLMAGLQMMAQKRDRLAKMQFKEGGEYDLSLEEVNRLRKLGYDLEEIS